MSVSESQPVSVEDLRYLVENGLGGVVLYDDPSVPGSTTAQEHTVALSQPMTGFSVIEVRLVAAVDSMGQVTFNEYEGSFEPRLLAAATASYITAASAIGQGLRIYKSSASTLHVFSGTYTSCISRVIGYR